jgi:hypothetical protein
MRRYLGVDMTLGVPVDPAEGKVVRFPTKCGVYLIRRCRRNARVEQEMLLAKSQDGPDAMTGPISQVEGQIQ